MARTFDGVDDVIQCSIGALNGVTGFGSIALIVRRVGSAEPVPIAAYQGVSARTAYHFDGGDMYYVTTAGFVTAGFTVDANIWNVAAVTKGTGTVSARFHQYGYDDGLWQRANSSGTVADGSGSSSTIRLGGPAAANPYDGDIAVAAWWKDVVLTDAQIDTLPYSLQAWLALAPTAMWVLDQSATTQTIIDLTGGGANQSSITGTAVSTSSAPFGYGFGEVIPHSVPAGGTTVNGAGLGAFTFGSTAAGVPTTPGSGAAALSFTGAASGTPETFGTASGAYSFTGSASGSSQATVTGAGLGAFTFGATATGAPETFGTGQVALTFTATAAGVPDVHGQGAGAFTFTGAASGVVEGVATGTGLGAYTFTAAAAGAPDVQGLAAGAFTFGAAATGVRVRLGQAVTTVAFTGTGLGAPRLSGQGVAALVFTGAASGTGSGDTIPDTNPLHASYREVSHRSTYREVSPRAYRDTVHAVYQEGS